MSGHGAEPVLLGTEQSRDPIPAPTLYVRAESNFSQPDQTARPVRPDKPVLQFTVDNV